MTPKRHGVKRGRRGLFYDPNGHGDLCVMMLTFKKLNIKIKSAFGVGGCLYNQYLLQQVEYSYMACML